MPYHLADTHLGEVYVSQGRLWTINGPDALRKAALVSRIPSRDSPNGIDTLRLLDGTADSRGAAQLANALVNRLRLTRPSVSIFAVGFDLVRSPQFAFSLAHLVRPQAFDKVAQRIVEDVEEDAKEGLLGSWIAAFGLRERTTSPRVFTIEVVTDEEPFLSFEERPNVSSPASHC
jgi:hypothetical protein